MNAGPAEVLACERRVAMRNHGRLDPRSLDDYVAKSHGYRGLERALSLGPVSVIEELDAWGLGAGRPSGGSLAESWRAARGADGEQKYVVVSAVDPDAKARIARALLEDDPHSVLEGLLIAAYAVGAARCVIAVNAEYVEALATLEGALEQLRDRGLLGERILGADFSCDVTVQELGGALVLGEETALLRALEGRQALPDLVVDERVRPRFHGAPVLVESAEALARVSAIFQEHPALQAEVTGGGGGADTKILAVSGDGVGERMVEVPLGTTLAAVLACLPSAGGDGAGVKAVRFGGPTGRFFAGSSLQTRVGHGDLKKAGSSMGSGGLEVFAAGRCAVEMARDVTVRLHEESCGKCAFCREGSRQVADILDDIVRSEADAERMELLEELAQAMTTGSICSLGRDASRPALSAMELFADDFTSHLKAKRCPEKSA